MSEYNDKLYDLVSVWLISQGINEKDQFSLENNGDDSDSKISKWGYDLKEPTKEQLLTNLSDIKQKKNLENYIQLKDVDEIDLTIEKGLFFSKGEVCVVLDGKLRKLQLN